MQIGDGTVIHLNIHGNFFRLDAVFSDEERLLLQIGTAYSALPNSIAFKVHRHKSVDLIQSGTYLKFAVFCSGAIAINFFTVNSFVIAADLCAGGLIYILDVELSIFFGQIIDWLNCAMNYNISEQFSKLCKLREGFVDILVERCRIE